VRNARDSSPDFPIQIRGLVAGYDEKVVLEIEKLAFERAKITCVLGPSGCGKSTLLRNILVLERPMKGQITVEGEDILAEDGQALTRFRRSSGVLFQGAALFNSLSLAENVAFPIIESGEAPRSKALEIAVQKLATVGLGEAADSLPSEVSGGMRKRAGIARAIAKNPKYLFLDEPSAGLDPITAAEIDILIKKIRERFETTIVVITHELASLHTIADELVMLAEGHMLARGTLEQVSGNPHPLIQDFFHRRPHGAAAEERGLSGRLREKPRST
jgi:phospholipid/cholesterol/gamma-HCH transport system ATP-binding protein